MASLPKGIELTQKISREAGRVLTHDGMQFIADLHRASQRERQHLLSARLERQAQFDKGELPDFRAATAAIREGSWKAAAIPRDLLDQRAGVVSPTSRRELLSALNSGARLCLADFADFTSPTWDNLIGGQINLMDRWTSAMEHTDPSTKRRVSLSQRLAVLMVRPRPMHLDEPRMKVDGKPIAASLFDAGLYLFHNARISLSKASGPYLCLSGLQSRHEARLWSDILVHAQSLLGLASGTVRVNVMIDSPSAAFDMDEIAYELRDHIVGVSLASARYAFSFVRSFGTQKTRVISDAPALDAALSGLLIKTAHKRGCLALAAMIRETPKANGGHAVRDGFDGMWTAHPDHVAAVTKIFNDDMPTANQIYVTREEVRSSQKDLLSLADGPRTDAVFRHNIRAALLGYEAWLSGRWPIAVDGVIEDAASVDFRRAQLWQWLRHGVKLETGKLTEALFEQCAAGILKQVKTPDGRFREAAALLKSLVLAKEFEPDFTVPAMRKLT